MTTKTINIRISKRDKEWLREMATLKRVTLSAFIREAARIEAHRVLGPTKPLRATK